MFFPGNGNFYAMGGRQSDAVGSDFVNPREFNPTTNTWAVKAAAYPNLAVCNMVGGVLTIGGQSVIVTVGGSAAGATTATSEVRQYDPVADTLTVIATDPWPGNVGGTVLPGGAAVVNNVLYVFGGFNIGVGMTSQIWKFDPALAAGSRWSLVPTALPAPRGYIPAAASGGFIYLAGGSDFVAALLVDTNQSLRFDPVTNALTPIAPIPRATGETRAVAHPFDNTIWVLGGGRTAPNPSTQVDVYNPATNTWSTAPPMTTAARRNFAADIDPQGRRIFAAGGYNAGNWAVALNDQLTCTVPATAVGLAVDTAGNGVYQPNETVVVAPSWMNTGATALALSGTFTNHTGPAGPTYTIPDGAADYGNVAIGATASCTDTGNCYSVANTTATRPATHWDSTVVETLDPDRHDEDLDAPHRQQLLRGAAVEPVLPLHRDAAPSRRDRRLHGDQRTARPAPPPASRWRCSSSSPRSLPATSRSLAWPARRSSTTSRVQPVLPLDRGAVPAWRRVRVWQRRLLPEQPGHA